jgi:branched-chain amino acid transport system substrate-binding protein
MWASAMRQARWCGAALLIGACGPARPAPIRIGVAYPRWARLHIAAAESTLRRTWGDSVALPEFVYDPDTTPERLERTVEFAQQLAADPRVSVIVGPSTSRAAIAVAPVASAAGIPLVIPNATSRLLGASGPWVFRLVPNDSVEGAFLAEAVVARGLADRLLVLYTNDEYGQGLRAGVIEALAHRGQRPTAELPVTPGSDFATLLQSEFAARPPRAILAAVRNPELVALLGALKAQRRRVPVFSGDGGSSPLMVREQVGALDFPVYSAAFAAPGGDSATATFARWWRGYAHQPLRPEDALTVDALVVAANAARATGGDRAAARRWLATLGQERPPFAGVTGPLGFGAAAARPVYLLRFEGDSTVAVARP